MVHPILVMGAAGGQRGAEVVEGDLLDLPWGKDEDAGFFYQSGGLKWRQ